MTSPSLRLATWNIRGNTGIAPARRADIVAALAELSPDIIVLQEVSWRGHVLADLMARLAASGWPWSAHGDTADVPGAKPYGNLIAARFPVEWDTSDWAPGLPVPGALLRAVVRCPEGDVAVIAVHIPNGSGHGWAKIETFEALARGLGQGPPAIPTLVAGDFNEPRLVREDGTVIPFGMAHVGGAQGGRWQGAQAGWSSQGTKKGACGRTFPRQRWVDGVCAILGQAPEVDLAHALRAVEGPGAWRVTHRVRGEGRFFDHILASSHWRMAGAGVEEGVMAQGVSDHGLVWAEFFWVCKTDE